MKKLLFLIFSAGMVITSCKNKPSSDTETTSGSDTSSALVSPDFSADSAYHYVQQQVDFGPRIPGTAAHAACANYLVNKLKSFKGQVFVQTGKVKTFDGKTFDLKNIIAAFYPEKKQRVLLTAHWDTRPFSDQDPDPANHNKTFAGANDGGSGVGVLLEVARKLAEKEPNVGVDIILWDVEDYGQPEDGGGFPSQENTYCLGSQYWKKNPPVANYKPVFGINLDMVGGQNARFTQEGYSLEYASDIVKKVWDTAAAIGYSGYFINKQTGYITDDHYWMNMAGFPAIDIIHFDETTESNFYINWHAQKDDMSGIDKNSLKAVGQTILEVVFRETSTN